mmetsp:Transcript_39768/g.46495  ORF Transcript_39768/g.46495 Transcript_39768/m.46495 type:complete len:441 (-) Transcript_39768:587-1909(-)
MSSLIPSPTMNTFYPSTIMPTPETMPPSFLNNSRKARLTLPSWTIMAMVLSVLTLSHSIIEVSSCGRPCSIEYCNDSCANDGDRNDDDCSKVVCMGGSLGNCDGCGSSTCSIFFASILEDENNSFECGSPIKDVIDDEKAFSPSTLVPTSTLPPTLDERVGSNSCESLCPEVEPQSFAEGSCDAQAFLGCPVCRYTESYCFFDCVADGIEVDGGMWAEACEGSYQGVPEPRVEVPTPDPTVTPTMQSSEVPTAVPMDPTTHPSDIPTSTVTIPQKDTTTEPVVIDSKAEGLTNAEHSELYDRSPTTPPSFAPSPAKESTIPIDTNSATPTNTNDGCEALCPEVEPISWVKDSCISQAFAECPGIMCQYSDPNCFFFCMAGDDADAGVGMWTEACDGSEQAVDIVDLTDAQSAGSSRRIQFWILGIGVLLYGYGWVYKTTS